MFALFPLDDKLTMQPLEIAIACSTGRRDHSYFSGSNNKDNNSLFFNFSKQQKKSRLK